jgi:hypothetical protein
MDLKLHYKELFDKYGVNPKSVQYTDKATQIKRFEILSQIDPKMSSVTDFGCGLGDLYLYLKDSFGYHGKYLGLDFVPDFVHSCNKIFSNDPNANFIIFDIKNDELLEINDYVLLSGVFNNKTPDNYDFMYNTIRKMFAYANKGVAFNSMSTYVDYQEEHLFYTNPLEVFDFCKREITSKVVLRHDYQVKENIIPFEYCIYLYK